VKSEYGQPGVIYLILGTMPMLAEVNFAISKRTATLVLRIGETVRDEETWTFPTVSQSEAKEAAMAIFSDAYDFLNICVHGDPEDETSTDEQPPDAEA
jgi:hypothetical protein